MKKIIFLVTLSIILLSSCNKNSDDISGITNDVLEKNETNALSSNTSTINLSQPERKMDLYWKIISIEWNEVTLLESDVSKDPTFNMTPEEKKKYMQSLDEATRTALKAEINSSTLWEIKLTIPVWISMVKKTASWPDSPTLEASLADIKNWQYISIWLDWNVTDRKVAEFVKIAFTQ